MCMVRGEDQQRHRGIRVHAKRGGARGLMLEAIIIRNPSCCPSTRLGDETRAAQMIPATILYPLPWWVIVLKLCLLIFCRSYMAL